MIVQTRYLAAKIEKLSLKIDGIAKDIAAQNKLFYIEKMADYIGSILTAKMFLDDRNVNLPIGLCDNLMVQISSQRNGIVYLSRQIINNLITSSHASEVHANEMADFIYALLDLLPKAIFMEYLLSARVGRISLAEKVISDGRMQYEEFMSDYRKMLSEEKRKVVIGGGQNVIIIRKQLDNIKLIMNSDENRYLLNTVKTGAEIS
jgi:hypothetical protein